MTEENQNDFYRRSPSDAKEMRHSTDELVRRLELAYKISAELRSIHAEIARLGELAPKIAAIAEALKELATMEQERNPSATKAE